jgi:hypothetical protein
VPITAKLSREFYEKFGDAVVDELVNWFNQVDGAYKLDLRELNELNFARFDAKLEQRIAELRAEFRADMAALRAEMHSGLARLEGGLLARIGQAEGRLARLNLVLWLGTLGTMIALLKM